jgi:Secretory lipase
MLGLAHDYANLSDWMNANLNPNHEVEWRRAESQCLTSNFGEFQNLSMARYFKRGYPSFRDAVPASVLRWGGEMGVRGTPKAPLFVYQNTGDRLSKIELADALVEKHCKAGANILVGP